MMFPSIAPMVVMYARIQEGQHERGQATETGTTALFIAGYLLTWTAAGLLGYAIIQGARALDLGFLAWDSGGPYVAGAVIVAAGLYQLTPLKDVCLRHCRSPMMFLLTRWRPGRLGALRMGTEHGGWCVGCCWGLMAALFAVGVMSIGWMVFVAALIATEKLLPWKAVANRGIALLLVVLGLGVAFYASDVPGLTLPDSPEAQAAMENMGMGGDSMGEEEMDDQKMPMEDQTTSGRSAARFAAAPTKSRKSGSGRVGRELNSGWNWEATKNGWSGSSMISTRRSSGEVPLATRPSSSNRLRSMLLTS